LTTDTFELDYKAYLPRIGRIRKKFDPDITKWRHIKDAIRSGRLLDWEKITKNFRVGSLMCPESLRPASRDAHKNLKGVYVFFQHGYVLRQGDSVALFSRADKRQRITTGQSIIVSSSPSGLMDHSGGIRKLESHIGISLKGSRPKPFAIGYSELSLQGKQKYPAYVWLLHEVSYGGKLPPSRQARAGKDFFRGMKKISKLHARNVQCDGEPVKIKGAFDKLLIELLAGDDQNIPGSNAAIRLLSTGEIRNIPGANLKKRDEKIRNRLASLGLIASTTSTVWFTKEVTGDVIDWARRSEWVSENWDEIVELLQSLERIGQAYF
jgi:hypothetical protein